MNTQDPKCEEAAVVIHVMPYWPVRTASFESIQTSLLSCHAITTVSGHIVDARIPFVTRSQSHT